jgi:hypothetical protein
MKVAVIGTGLSAYGSIKALLDIGIKPVVFDIGDIAESSVIKFKNKLRKKNPTKWSKEDISKMENFNNINKNKVVRKLFFGSSFLYKNLNNSKNSPTFTSALGGYSNVWSGSALIPAESDLINWPKESVPTYEDYLNVCKNIPYSGYDDNLKRFFNHPSEINFKIEYPENVIKLKKKLDLINNNNFVSGYARYFINAAPQNNKNNQNSCRYCGFCMTGCAYDSIFNSGTIIDKLYLEKKIFLKKRYTLKKFLKNKKKITLIFDNDSKVKIFHFDKVFVGAGSLNTTKIIVNSLDLYEDNIKFKYATYIVAPMLYYNNNFNWPKKNTLSPIFLELKNKKIRNWIHCQINEPNEIILSFLKFFKFKNFFRYCYKFFLSKILTIQIQLHSRYGGVYNIKFFRNNSLSVENKIKNNKSNINYILNDLKQRLLLVNVYLIKYLAKYGNQLENYYIGCSFPMSKSNNNTFTTDACGRLKNFNNLHLVDATIFPSIPSTTLGLLLMANAYRITRRVLK